MVMGYRYGHGSGHVFCGTLFGICLCRLQLVCCADKTAVHTGGNTLFNMLGDGLFTLFFHIGGDGACARENDANCFGIDAAGVEFGICDYVFSFACTDCGILDCGYSICHIGIFSDNVFKRKKNAYCSRTIYPGLPMVLVFIAFKLLRFDVELSFSCP